MNQILDGLGRCGDRGLGVEAPIAVESEALSERSAAVYVVDLTNTRPAFDQVLSRNFVRVGRREVFRKPLQCQG